MSSCCHIPEPSPAESHCHEGYNPRKDILLIGMFLIIVAAVILHFTGWHPAYLGTFAHAVAKLIGMMWWGIAGGIVAVGIMSHIPRSYFQALMGRGDTVGGVIRATLAGLLLDLCSHGILMVGAKLYERGVSLAQVMAFLIASPWNSITLTLILISLIGLPWTLAFTAASALLAITTGIIYLHLVKHGYLPPNPHTAPTDPGFDIKADFRTRVSNLKITPKLVSDILKGGFIESLSVLRWLFLGVVLAALIQTFISDQAMATWFGPTIIGLLLTLLTTTIIEVCSEGSTPIGADLVIRAGAPGNGFTFLMAGVSTDYTEVLVLKQTTKSWKIALSLPLLTVPQIVLLGWLMNQV
ncbi:MAG: permease [Micavibrio aeruginosavorus]|uniref:Permease n=1 Tax=Micavibrio aeruginosavorus TaxID=349221 RepID=A0A7T5UIL2_9BACT|nr:MAG: permease [Micavibrio aeruginosavorus]